MDLVKYPFSGNSGVRYFVRRRVGATLIEASIFLLIFVAVLGGVLAVSTGVLGQNTVARELQILTNLSGSVVRTKSINGYGTTSQIMQALDEMNLVPGNVSRTGSGSSLALRNGWGGAVTITPTNGGGSFSITYAQIPKGDCVQLMNSLKPGILQSIGSGASATMNMTEVTSDVVSGTLCTSATNTVTWDSSIL